jgi:hypothetical protein
MFDDLVWRGTPAKQSARPMSDAYAESGQRGQTVLLASRMRRDAQACARQKPRQQEICFDPRMAKILNDLVWRGTPAKQSARPMSDAYAESGQRGQTVNRFLEVKTTLGGVLKWTTRLDCKSSGYAFEGSNPSPTTIL